MNLPFQRPFTEDGPGRTVPIPLIIATLLLLMLLVGIKLPSLAPAGPVLITFAMASIVTVIGVTVRFGIRGLAFLLLTLGTGFLGLTGIRISSSIAVSDLFWFALIGLTIPFILLSKRKHVNVSEPLIRAVLLLDLGAFIAGLFSPDIVESQIRLAKMATATLLIPMLVMYWQLQRIEVRILTWTWIGSVVVSCLYGLINGPDDFSVRSSGLTTHPNILGLSAVLTLGPALTLIFSGSRLPRLIATACTVVLFGGIMVSGSRAALVGAAITIMAFALLIRRRQVLVPLFAAAFIGIAVIGTGLYQPPGVAFDRLIGSQEHSSGIAQSNEGRLQHLNDSIDRTLERPFIGWGLAQARAAHTVYLQVLESSGVIGFIGFVMVIVVSLKPTIQFTRRRTISFQDPSSLLAMGLSAGLIGFLVAELFSNVLWERFLWFHIALLVSTTSLAFKQEPTKAESPSHNKHVDSAPLPSNEAARN